MPEQSITAEPPPAAAPPGPRRPGRAGRYATGALFLAPALVLLAVWIVYPTVYTIVRSFFGINGFNALRRDRQLQGAVHDRDGC